MVGCQIELVFSDNTVLPPLVWGWGGPPTLCARVRERLIIGKLLLVSLIPPEFVDHTPGKVLVSLDVVNELRFGDVDPVIIIRFAA